MIVQKLAPMIAALTALVGTSRGVTATEVPGRWLSQPPHVTPIAPTWSAPLSFSNLVMRRFDRPDVREVEMPGLPDTAMAEMTGSGPVIFYNPELFRAAGPAREFVRAHEYAHVLLDHLQNQHMLTTDEGRSEAEAQADCFAAQHSSPLSVVAMTRLLLRRPPESRDAIYGSKPERARRILACAGISQG
ncbi:Hypothetical protein A7982_02271 [Minicystis rosea]|nr:Hypothetical protein A7982_02271 [Minicystis rosea]